MSAVSDGPRGNDKFPDPASAVVATDGILKLMTEYHWESLGEVDTRATSGYFKPLFQSRDWKCMVGKLWTTIWRLTDTGIAEMDSFKTDDPDRVEVELRKIAGLATKKAKR